MNQTLALSDEEVDFWGDQYLKWQQPIPEDLLNRLSEFERQQYFWAHSFTFSEFIDLCLGHVRNSTPLLRRAKQGFMVKPSCRREECDGVCYTLRFFNFRNYKFAVSLLIFLINERNLVNFAFCIDATMPHHSDENLSANGSSSNCIKGVLIAKVGVIYRIPVSRMVTGPKLSISFRNFTLLSG